MKSVSMVAAAFLVGFAASTSGLNAKDIASAMPFAGKACEAHVWAFGRPNFKPKSSAFIRYTPPSAEDLANPLSNVNVFSPLKRAETLSDVQIAALFPGAASVKIVHHNEVIDLDKTPITSIKAPLVVRQGDCYADLGIANLYPILPNPDAPYERFGAAGGALASVIAGSDRLVIDFWFQQWSSNKGGQPYVFRRKKDSPLPHVEPATTAMLDASRAAADVNLADFVATVNGRRKE